MRVGWGWDSLCSEGRKNDEKIPRTRAPKPNKTWNPILWRENAEKRSITRDDNVLKQGRVHLRLVLHYCKFS